MAENRYYGSGTEKALFMLSRGTCYEPTCNVRVLKMTKSGRPQVIPERCGAGQPLVAMNLWLICPGSRFGAGMRR